MSHEERHMADAWCKERGMKYRFIENSRGALFAENTGIDRMARTADKRF